MYTANGRGLGWRQGIRTPLSERFWAKVERGDPDWCWEWVGSRSDGYGTIRLGGRHGSAVRAHRVSYELLVGPIPAGLDIDHLCRNHGCVNPKHLEPVTRRVNILRGVGASAVHARKTHCKNGHEFTPENTRRNERGWRACRACNRIALHSSPPPEPGP